MSVFKIESCFGADINVGYFDIDEILSILEIKDTITASKRIKSLIKLHGRKDRIIGVAMRQLAFDVLHPMLDSEFLPYDPYFSDDKLLNGRRERLYDAQERLLILCMSIASGRSVKSLKKLNPDLNTKELRSKYGRGQSLFRYFRQELNEHTREYILSYKARMETGDSKNANLSASANSSAEEGAEQTSAVKPALVKKAPVESKLIPTSFDDETVTALKIFQDGYSLLSTQVERFKRGEKLEMLELMKFCRRLIESHSRNNFSLMAIRHIKDASIYLEQHAMGMAVLGIHFAKAMKLSSAYVEVITLGALLFDLGRFRLPMAMVTKATKMTDSEFDLFRKHIQFGEQILQKCDGVPKAVYQMLSDHHEKIDGSGYPAGKQDLEISVYGKIAAIIDAYDAMTSEQPHKHSMGPIKACQQMQKESGLAFDKQLLSVFLKSIGSIPVGSCVLLSNGRIGFVLTLNKSFQPSLVRQVYSMTNKAFVETSDIELNKSANLRTEVRIEKEVDPQTFGLQFINHIS
ncbi:HD domain-containing protein [Marinomonas rhizomae]|uniref:HD-GYP domain-containing protein (C-di-GMP phosphodiesterase class II) n=1 Tax=Marinomonas rhizomae TaxID=491948 RepID=A0A366J5V3_9GAMM|nr:HD domain-containing phosphohydrolase [Marinomonas rhizomae]RBP82413.1 HD-GYP domain-containing protein (c-di-GMP phosphodiesterase class II) [Marinomonas rhizomae]RNF73790.1 HD domain-containing protein [Marinomonas rhizomae]